MAVSRRTVWLVIVFVGALGVLSLIAAVALTLLHHDAAPAWSLAEKALIGFLGAMSLRHGSTPDQPPEPATPPTVDGSYWFPTAPGERQEPG